MGYIALAIMGLIAGAIAKFIIPGKDPGGIIVTMIIGVVGAFIGNAIRTFIGSGNGEIDFMSPLDWFFAIGGSAIILIVWKKLLAPIFNKEA